LTRARDVANVLSTATSLATDTETAAAISSHNSATTSVHGISDTSALATQTYVQNNKGINKGNTASRPASPANGDLYYNTETSVLEVYDGGWWLPNTAAGIPTSPVATNSGSGRAYNNGSASVAFTPATSGGKATSFTVTSTPGSYTNTGSSSPIVVTGLQSNTAYTYAVTATGPLGTSSASSASTAVTATTVPQAPAIGTVSITNGTTVSIPFTVNTGGSSISSISITSSPSIQLTYSGTSSPVSVTGDFALGQSYTFTMIATNSNGSSNASTASNSVGPNLIATVTGGTLTSDATYYYRTFTGSSNLDISGTSLNADVLMVAGGGGSGWDAGGGGGGGGVIIASNKTIGVGSYPIVIGSGGTYVNVSRGSTGNNTTGLSLTALGGGGGGYYSNTTSGLSGGSGGGGASISGSAGSATQTSGAGYVGYGNNGGSGSSSHYGSGGGGGAGGVGSNGIQNSIVSGGLPLYNSNFNNTSASIAYSGGGYGNSDGGPVYNTGYNASNVYVGYYGFGGNGQGQQDNLTSNNHANPGVFVIKYTRASVGG
jgi:hypothetical protein